MAALAAYRFDVMGSVSSHYEFYLGQGWYLSATLAMMIAMCIILSNAAEESPVLVRRLSLVIALFFAVSVALCVKFFFIAPLVTSLVASASCATAWWRLRSA